MTRSGAFCRMARWNKARSVPIFLQSRVAPGVGEAFGKIVAKCLAKDRRYRYFNAEEVLTELQNAQRDISVREQQEIRRRPAYANRTSALIALLIGYNHAADRQLHAHLGGQEIGTSAFAG